MTSSRACWGNAAQSSRTVCPSNRRKVEIMITASGADALQEMDGAVQQAENKLMESFSDQELSRLNALLDQIQ